MPSQLVSIVIPTFNSEKFLEKTLLSVFSQTYKNIETIVIDGGSNDNTINIIKKYTKNISSWISEKDSGQSSAINKGLKIAKGHYITWLGSDDMLYKDTVEKVVEVFDSNQSIGLIYGDLDYIDQNDQLYKKSKFYFLTLDILLNKKQSVPQPGSFYRSTLVKGVGYLNESLHYTMDYDLFIRLLKVSEGYYLGCSLAQFRMHEENKSTIWGGFYFPIEGFKVGHKYGGRLFTELNIDRLKRIVKFFIRRILTK